MLQIAGSFGGQCATLRDKGAGPAEAGRGEGGREDTGENWRSIGALAGAVVERLRRTMQDNKALVAFLAGMAMGDAYRELLRVAAADKPGLRAMAQEIEAEALERVASFGAMPLDGAGQIDGLMDQVRALAGAHWKGSARTASRAADPETPGGVTTLAPVRRRGRNPLAAE